MTETAHGKYQLAFGEAVVAGIIQEAEDLLRAAALPGIPPIPGYEHTDMDLETTIHLSSFHSARAGTYLYNPGRKMANRKGRPRPTMKKHMKSMPPCCIGV